MPKRWFNTEAIQKTLDEFDVRYTSVEKEEGYNVSEYHIWLKKDEKISRIESLKDEISLVLRSQIEISLNYQKGCLTFEVPHKEQKIYRFEEALEQEQFVGTDKKLPMIIGCDKKGHIFVPDLSILPHLLIAGSTGSGKSTLIHSIVNSLLHNPTPKHLILVDLKRVELALYEDLPNVNVFSEMRQLTNLFETLLSVIDDRYNSFKEMKMRNISEYNDNPNQPTLPFIIVVIDEYAEIALQDKKIPLLICRLAQKGRAAGVHVVLATQRPSRDIVTGVIKGNFVTRIALKTAQKIDSRIILEESGAERLIGRGDLLYKDAQSKVTRIQGAYVLQKSIFDYVSNNESDEKTFDIQTSQFNKTNLTIVRDSSYEVIKKHFLTGGIKELSRIYLIETFPSYFKNSKGKINYEKLRQTENLLIMDKVVAVQSDVI